MNPFMKYTLATALLALGLGSTQAQNFTRKPFLQLGAPNRASVCWRVTPATVLNVKYGTDAFNLDKTSPNSANGTDACVQLDSLQPSTRYYYDVFSGTTKVTAATQYLQTHPTEGSRGKYEFWIVGDPGSGTSQQQQVRNAFRVVNNGSWHADGFIMLGDNAYEQGTDAQFTSNAFSIYTETMANTFTWPTIGNHENMTSSGSPYLNSFYLPTAGQSGGVASGSELYYSYNYGNIHFIILDSEISNRTKTGPMYLWLKQDLAANQADWTVAYWHHPSYTWGSHNSDTESKHLDMRGTFQPLLEDYGVDMVFAGHSHDYERSFFLDSAYGLSSDNVSKRAKIVKDSTSGNPATTGPYRKTPGAHNGAVYTVAGSSGKLDVVTNIVGKHPMMWVQHLKYGSMILTIEDSVATARFIDTARVVQDQFQIVKSRPPASISGKPERVTRSAALPKFMHMGARRFQFESDNAVSFRVYATDGSVAFEGVPQGRWEPSKSVIPTGGYYYRFGTAFGRLSLP